MLSYSPSSNLSLHPFCNLSSSLQTDFLCSSVDNRIFHALQLVGKGRLSLREIIRHAALTDWLRVACHDFCTFSDAEGFVTCQRYHNLWSAPVEQESVRDNLGLVTDEPNVPWNTTRTEFSFTTVPLYWCRELPLEFWNGKSTCLWPLQKLQRIQMWVPVS